MNAGRIDRTGADLRSANGVLSVTSGNGTEDQALKRNRARSGHGAEPPQPVRTRARDADGSLRFALRRLVEREAVCQRISHALHDELGQALSALNLGLYRIAHRHPEDMDLLGLIDELRGVLEEAAIGTRRLAAGFRSRHAVAGPLRAVVAASMERFHAESGLNCLATVDDRAATMALEQTQATALQTLLLLALSGVARHRPAARIRVRVRADEHGIVIEIRAAAHPDAQQRARAARSGITSMAELDELAEWLTALGGALHLGDGGASFLLRLEVTLPFPG